MSVGFGDWFEAASALFSGLAFAGVIYALFLQMEELALQRQELEQTRRELRRTAEAQEGTERALKRQVLVAALTSASNAALIRAKGMPGVPSGRPEDFVQLELYSRELQEELDKIREEK